MAVKKTRVQETRVQFATMVPVNVREWLAKTLTGRYANFWLQPPVYHAGMWQGGEQLQVKRTGENEFKVGTLPRMSLERAAVYVEEMLDRYNVPYHKSSGCEPKHPFTFQI